KVLSFRRLINALLPFLFKKVSVDQGGHLLSALCVGAEILHQPRGPCTRSCSRRFQSYSDVSSQVVAHGVPPLHLLDDIPEKPPVNYLLGDKVVGPVADQQRTRTRTSWEQETTRHTRRSQKPTSIRRAETSGHRTLSLFHSRFLLHAPQKPGG